MQCEKCGAPVTKDTRFCAGCGTAMPWAQAFGAGRHAAVLGNAVDLDSLTELNMKKKRLTTQLEVLLEDTGERGASEEEQQQYRELRQEWQRLSDSMTDKMNALSTRTQADRRTSESRLTQRRLMDASVERDDRRTGSERRDDERRTYSDRRTPFPDDVG